MQVTRKLALLIFLVSTLQAAANTALDAGINAFNQGRYSVALPQLQQAAKNSTDKSASVCLALTEAALGDCNTALPNLLVVDKTAVTLRRLAGLAAVKCYIAESQNTRAFTLLTRLQSEFPNDPDVIYTSAKLHMKAFNEATFAMFQHAPASYRVHELSAEIFEVQTRYTDAASEYRKAIEANPTAPDLHYRLGRALLLQSHSPEALTQAAEQFRAELQISPEDSSSEFQLGQIFQVQGDTVQARSYFERALQLSPKFAAALIALGKIYSKDKQYDRAIALLTRAIAVQPQNEAAHYALLTTYRDAGQLEKANSEKATLDKLQKPPEGEFSDFLKKLGEKQPEQ